MASARAQGYFVVGFTMTATCGRETVEIAVDHCVNPLVVAWRETPSHYGPGAENATKRHQAHTPEPPPKEVRHPRRSCDLSSLTSSAAHSRASGTLDCGRRLAAQRDAVTADDVAAHGGFSWLVRRPAAASGPTHALFAAQSHSIVDNLVVLLRYRRALDCSPANCMRLALISRFTAGFWYQADMPEWLPSFST
jgi:hypothetical protein